jgi:hypothetical protein
MTERMQLTPREDERLLALMRRSDALSSACAAIEDWDASPEAIADALEALGEMRTEAHAAFMRWRRDIGLPE